MKGQEEDMQPAESSVVQFIEDRGPQFHHVFAMPSYFDKSTSTFEAKIVFELRETIERCKIQTPNLVDFNLDINYCTWEEVKLELHKAKAAAAYSRDRAKSFIPGLFYELGKGHDYFEAALDAIPDSARVLRAGLAVIFCLARHRVQVRQKILDAFENIPNIVQTAELKLRTLVRAGKEEANRELNEKVKELQKTLLETIPHLIEALNPGTFRPAPVRRALSPFRGFNIDELLGTVYRKADTVHIYTERIKDEIITDTHNLTWDTRKLSRENREKIDTLHAKIDEVLKEQKNLQSLFDLSSSSKNFLFQFLMDNQKRNGSMSAESSADTLVNEPRSFVPAYPGPTFTPNELLELLEVPHLGLNEDKTHVLRHGRSLDNSTLSAASLLICCRQVQHLFGTPTSGIVLVEGCGDRSQSARVSPISVVCATLSHTLQSRPTSVTLLFFCGRHVASDDELCGPLGLMRSLLSQLILLMVQKNWVSGLARIGLSCGEEESEWKGLSLHDVCQLFYRVLESIPLAAEVICIIDGISFFERDEWCHDYDLVMNTFGTIIDEAKLNPKFKLLMTTPTRSSRLSSLEQHQRVALRNNGSQMSIWAAFRAADR
ncbi:hypothetical protein CMQ_442 [Grosmannia clavigera kw1407]|uniref:Uncharacterized protein n=1 Tax=Grosmannia clavigera (strain kw1407 / UAMH 11150) TaxID=655863 RepID=F0XCM4_GROCL|nr:uncharacterized protein CMQ_442 [Grosmannia clavigera kw1407]EFX03514.1 hypothetical protein CMQ_442 [Grosmannia clavigera kw1407]